MARVGSARSLTSAIVALAMMTSHAHAQSSAPAFHHAERRSQLHDQNVAAGVLYVATILSGTWGLIGGFALVADAGAPACTRCDHNADTAILFSALGSAAAAGVLMIIAIVLSIDHRVRSRALDRASSHASLAPEPGDVGLALSWAFD